MLRRGLIAATLPEEAVCLRIVALTWRPLPECFWLAAVPLGSIVQQHILCKPPDKRVRPTGLFMNV